MQREPYPVGFDMWVSAQLESGNTLETSIELSDIGPASRTLRDVLGSDLRTSSFVANAFWQGYVFSDEFRRAQLAIPGVDKVGASRMLVVPHGLDQFALVVESRFHDGDNPRVLQVSVSDSDLLSGWERFHSNKQPLGDTELDTVFPRLLPRAALEANKIGTFWLILTRPQEEVLTSVPSRGLRVQAASSHSTAGAFVQDSFNCKGVTAALHAVNRNAAITVAGMPATYRKGDQLTDSCFLEVADYIDAHPPVRNTSGVLTLAPRSNDEGTFEGVETPAGTARIIAWSYELPFIDPNLTPTVRTDQVTAEGDSGVALIDSDGYMIGFAHSRSGYSHPVTYSTWIWASAVFQRLGLKTY